MTYLGRSLSRPPRIPRPQFINKLRELTYTYKTRTKRISLWKKRGGTHYVSVPNTEKLTEPWVISTLRQCGLSDDEIRSLSEVSQILTKGTLPEDGFPDQYVSSSSGSDNACSGKARLVASLVSIAGLPAICAVDVLAQQVSGPACGGILGPLTYRPLSDGSPGRPVW